MPLRLASTVRRRTLLALSFLVVFCVLLLGLHSGQLNDVVQQAATSSSKLLPPRAARQSSRQLQTDSHRTGLVLQRDIVVALPTDDERVELVKVSRGPNSWRQGMRTLVLQRSAPDPDQVAEGLRHNETWLAYPNDVPAVSENPGCRRAAIAPFMAHKVFSGSYKWMLYGDDDTFWFLGAVLDLLPTLDPEMPYFLTDHDWFFPAGVVADLRHPNPRAPRCLPCGFDDSGYNKSRMPFAAPKGCPCTPQLLCSTDEQHIFNAACDIPVHPAVNYAVHGGAGVILSIGLLRRVGFDTMEQCFYGIPASTGGDALLTRCLWREGYAITDPGPSFFEPTRPPMFDSLIEDTDWATELLLNSLACQCNARCQDIIDHHLSIHIRPVNFPGRSYREVVNAVQRLSRLYYGIYMKYGNQTCTLPEDL